MSSASPRWLAVSAGILVAISIAAAGRGLAGPSQGDPAKGKKMFEVKCIACHKVNGSGGFKVTGNPTPDWRDKKRMSEPAHNDDYLRDCITNGKIKSGMVAWSKQGVKPQEIENLIAYIRTFSGTKSAEAKPDSVKATKAADPKAAATDSANSTKPDSAAQDTTHK